MTASRPDRLEGDRLAAGVRPGDDQHLELDTEVHVDRHDARLRTLGRLGRVDGCATARQPAGRGPWTERLQQGVPRLTQDQPPLVLMSGADIR